MSRVPADVRRSARRCAVAAAGLLLLLSGCSALRRIQVFPVSIVNDTNAPVVVRGCESYCSSSLLTFDLPPGSSVVVHRTTQQHKRFSIVTPAGGHVGCADLYFTTPQPAARVLVSGAVPCPSGSHVRWTLIGLAVAAALAPILIVLGRSRR